MQNDKLKNYLHLHLLVFIAGFTAIIGKLITINAVSLVWYRMLMATVLMFVYIKIAKVDISITKKSLIKLSIAGVIIALHWITFFGAIQVANASIALAMFSTGAFFASFIEPIIYKRKIIAYEIVFGLIVILGVYLIVKSEFKYIDGMILGIISAFLSSLFAVLNGKFLEEHSATKISFYEFLSGVFFISLYILLFGDGFNLNHFNISLSDGLWLFVLASVCTAYAFIASVYVMRYISPYTVVLTYNLEPIYGIILALMLFPESETMSPSFYIGAFIILGVVLLNGVLKNLKKFRKNKSPQTN
ncbi:DMT family transporter [Olleya sp. UBA1516]|uniref:DMT family transporter n=1 Tax=Olleya sp. UBA1516 TaxID=1947013 RepID=UPI0025DD21B6|nr:DMT family transporter [Olleya sp. UBA1516]|tara:strand:+ start:283188 stop:284096 length:909 start_codon:yes stop_codon:yes gene_type:complete